MRLPNPWAVFGWSSAVDVQAMRILGKPCSRPEPQEPGHEAFAPSHVVEPRDRAGKRHSSRTVGERRNRVRSKRLQIEAASEARVADSTLLPPTALAQEKMQHAAANHLLSVLFGNRARGPGRCADVGGNPAAVVAIRDPDQRFGNNIGTEPFTNSQPEVQVLARRAGSRRSHRLRPRRSDEPCRADVSPTTFFVNSARVEVDRAARDVPTHAPVGKYPLGPGVDESRASRWNARIPPVAVPALSAAIHHPNPERQRTAAELARIPVFLAALPPRFRS